MAHLTEKHHAILFACIAEKVINEIGEKNGGPLLRRAVLEYGRQRGKRMAMRALNNGHDLTMDNYLAYCEWRVPKDAMEIRFLTKNPHARVNIFKCPWHSIWEEHNLIKYGKYFCMEIDAALVKGFNPDLEIEIHSTRTNGGGLCDFVFKGARLSLFNALFLLYKKKIRPGKSAVMPWSYHTAHLYKTMGVLIKKELGSRADGIIQGALSCFSSFFSKTDAAEVTKLQDIDFEKLPEFDVSESV